LSVTLVLYTTVYPGVESYLADWYGSVLDQTDRDFQLWIGLDAIDAETAAQYMGGSVDAMWIQAGEGATPAQVRQRAWETLVGRCDEVVLVDSDDVLLPSRVATAREMLRASELAGCALQLVDAGGADLGLTFTSLPLVTPEEVLPRNNIFGLSNSAYRSALLRRCLPVPPEVELVDWYLATRAWLLGASMTFGRRPEMKYRQHSTNMVRVVPPFDAGQIARDAERVRHHFRLVGTSDLQGARPDRVAGLMEAATDVECFNERVVLEPAVLKRYVEALNASDMCPLWWSSVAHRSLQHMWASPKERT
jgi:hypothetical protein